MIIMTAAAAIAATAMQEPYPYPDRRGTWQQQAYPAPGYGYSSGGLQGIVDQLLGNRYSVSDRTAVRQCATAAVAEASNTFRANGYGYGQGYERPYGNAGYSQGYPATARVTAITGVERRPNGLRVTGMMDSGAYANRAYADRAAADLSFRCNVDYRGAVTNVRVRRAGY